MFTFCQAFVSLSLFACGKRASQNHPCTHYLLVIISSHPKKMATFSKLSTDVLLVVLSFVSALDNYKMSVSRRLVYLIDELQRLRPELVVSSAPEGGKSEDVVARALAKLSSRPNIAFAFYTGATPRNDWIAAVEMQMPKDTVVLAARSSCVQTNANKMVSSEEDLSLMVGSFPEAVICPFSLSVHNSNTSASVPYHVQIEMELLKLTPPEADPQTYWKVFTVYVTGKGAHHADDCIQELQKLHPKASIIGGICGGGDIRMATSRGNRGGRGSGEKKDDEDDEDEDEDEEDGKTEEEKINNMSVRQLKGFIIKHHSNGAKALLGVTEKSELRQLGLVASGACSEENKMKKQHQKLKQQALQNTTFISCGNSIFGVALGGNVPLRSVVSRGVRSIVSKDKPFKVQASTFVQPGDDKFPYQTEPGDGTKAQHMIGSVTSGSNQDSTTMTGQQFVYNLAVDKGINPDYVGIRQMGEDGYTLHQVHRGMLVHDSIVLESNEDEQAIDNSGAAGSVGSGLVESLNGADIDMFKLDGPSCIADLDRTLMRLSDQLCGEQLLGALMFSCGGRGPSKRGMMGEEMMDANHFNHHFDLPCLGFYAGGEIGPMAKADNTNVFQQGKVALQGFTVVFGVFVVPIPTATKYLRLDDSDQNCRQHMSRKVERARIQKN